MPRRTRRRPKEDFPDTRSPREQKKSSKRKLFRLFALTVLLAMAVVFLGGIGSLRIRKMVVDKLQAQAVTAASVVLSAPFVIALDSDLAGTRVIERLRRLGYRERSDDPTLPGEFVVGPETVKVFLREARVTGNKTLPEQLISLGVVNGKISQIHNQSGAALETVTLEPETLSLLGNSATRASTPFALDQFPSQLVNAVIAIEDERFYQHFGLDLFAIARALVVNLQAGRTVQGGSTITQQLAKNLLLSNERTLSRKITEAVAAPLLETAYTKDQILEFYLNEIFLAQEGNVAIHGFGEAAQSLYGKDVRDLTLAESALLAGLIKAPSKYSPRAHMDRAVERQQVVLDKMHELKIINDEELAQAKAERISIQPAQRARRVAPYFVDYVRRTLEAELPLQELSQRSIRVHTGIDREYQECAERAVDAGIESLIKRYPRLKKRANQVQVALVSVVPHSGEVRAWVGGADYAQNQFDRVSLASRQPGSSFKPFVYLTALDKNLNSYRVARTTSLLEDEPMTIVIPGSGTWSPENYDHEYRHEVTLRYALSHSLNIPTVNLAQKIGIDAVARTAELFGFGTNLPRVPSLALGAGEVTPLTLARAYAVLANGGMLVKLRPILSVGDVDHPDSIAKWAYEEKEVASKQAVYVLTDMLRSVVDAGTANSIRRAGFTRPAAGKTGTTNEMRDAWFAGFTPTLLTVVWTGFDDNTPIGLTGGQGPAPIWAEYMKCVSPLEPELDFVPPEGVVSRRIDPRSGLLADSACGDGAINEVFVEGTEPVTYCSEEIHPDEFLEGQNAPLPNGLPPAQLPPARDSLWDRIWN